MAKKTDTPKVTQHLLSDDARRNWKVLDIAVVSPTSVSALLQNDEEWCIDTFDYDRHVYQRGKRICLQTKWLEPPLLLSYVHLDNNLKHLICTKTSLHFIDDESETVENSLPLSAKPSALCVNDNTVYISTNETKNLMHFKPELPTDTSKICLKGIFNRGIIVEFIVHSKNIYVCTNDGKVSSHKETGEKQHDYRNRKSIGSKARGLAVFTPQGKECNLLLVTWNDNKLIIYSTQTSYDLLDIDLNVPGKVRVTTSCFLMSSEMNDVAIYDMKTVADRGAFKMILVSGSKDKDLSYLYNEVLHDTTTVGNVLIKRKSLKTLVEVYDYSCKTNDKLNAKKKKLKDEIDRSKKEKDDLTEELENTRSKLSRKEADLSDLKATLDEARTESDELRIMNEGKEEKCCSLTKQLDEERKTTEELKNEIERSKKEKDDLTEELENTRSRLITKEADLSDLKATLDDARTESDELRIMNEEKEEKCCSLTKQLEEERKTTEELKHEIERSKKEKDDVTEELENIRSNLSRKKADLSGVKANLDDEGNTKDTVAVSTENMKTEIRDLIDVIKDDTEKLKKKEEDVTRELKSTKLTLEKKEVDRLQIQKELDAAILQKRELEKKTAMETGTPKQTIEDKDKEIRRLRMLLKIAEKDVKNAKTQVTLLRDMKEELKNSVRREQQRSKELKRVLAKLAFFNTKNVVQLEDAKNRLRKEHDKDEKTQTLLSKILESLDRDALILQTESEIVTEILQTKGKHQDMLVCLHSDFNSRIEKLKREAELLEYKMGQQNTIIDFEKKNRSALPDMVEQSCTYNEKQEVTAMGLEHNALPDNANTLDKEIPLTPKRLPEDEQMLETREEGVTEMTSFQAGAYSRLEQIQNFRVTKENRQLSFIENKLQGVQDKVKYETFQFEYLKDLFESSDNLLGVLQKSTFLKTVDALITEISNGKDKLEKLKDNRDNTVEEYEVQRDWFQLHELQVSLVVSEDGGKLQIPGSDVSLDIPPGALQEQREIQMKIIPHCLDPGGDSLSFSSNSSVVVELLPNKLQFQKTVHLRLPHCLHLNDNYNSLQDVEVLISHHEKGDTPKWDVSTDTACTLQKDHCVIPLKQFCWITYRVDDKVVTAKRLKIFTAGRVLELSDRESEVEVGYFPDLPGSGEILRDNPKLSRGQIKPFLFQKNEEESTLLISLQQVIPTEWQNNIELGDQQIISYQSVCTGTEMSCPFHLQYKPEGSPSGKVPLCLFHVTQKNAERISITFRPEVKCDED